MEYFTYAYLREDGSPYYIGKGKGLRETTKHSVIIPPRERILRLKSGMTEEEAFRHEIYMISVFGRKDIGTGILRNRTDGGEGTSGHIQSEETRKKMSETWKKKGTSNRKGKTNSEESNRMRSQTLKERFARQEHHCKGRPANNKGKTQVEKAGTECPYCGSIQRNSNYKRHVEKCNRLHQ